MRRCPVTGPDGHQEVDGVTISSHNFVPAERNDLTARLFNQVIASCRVSP